MIQSLARGLDILCILQEKNGAGITEIAAELGINKSSASRMIDTLKHYDMVQLDKSTKKYRLGLRVLTFGEGVKRNIEVISVARPYLSALSGVLEESVHLCALSNNRVYVVDQIRSNRPYSLSATVGMTEPIHSSSVGKCILAFRRLESAQKMLEGYELTKYSEKTITSLDALMKELDIIRAQGYAIDNEEMFAGVRCLAAPIFKYKGIATYSLGVSSLSARISDSNVAIIAQKLIDVAGKISAELRSR